MSKNRPFALTIAGFDPSAGAGVLADIKTFEQHEVYGFAILTANTIQTENKFYDILWTDLAYVLQSIKTLLETYEIKVVKIGIVASLDYLKSIVFLIKKVSPKTKIVWDTVLKSSTEFNFLEIKKQSELVPILNKIELITPNYNELLKLGTALDTIETITERLSKNCAILLKGGHHPSEIGTDFLSTQNQSFRLSPKCTTVPPKHGSGCVLSAAIAANLALEQTLLDACKNAKIYTENFLLSNSTPLGYHYAT